MQLKSSEMTPSSSSISATCGVKDDRRFLTTAIAGLNTTTRSPKSDTEDNLATSFSSTNFEIDTILETCLAFAISDESIVEYWILFSFIDATILRKASSSFALSTLCNSSRCKICTCIFFCTISSLGFRGPPGLGSEVSSLLLSIDSDLIHREFILQLH